MAAARRHGKCMCDWLSFAGRYLAWPTRVFHGPSTDISTGRYHAHVFWTYLRKSSASVYRSIAFSFPRGPNLAWLGPVAIRLYYSLCFASRPNL